MKQEKDRLFIVIPAYNEQDTIKDVVSGWHSVVKKIGKNARLLVIDDGSRDNTYAELKKLSKKYTQLVCESKKNSGHGATVLYGYEYALKKGADYVFQTDSDGQTLPSEFWNFWKERKKYDMIIGYRKGRKDGMSRVIVTRVLRLAIRACFKEKILDANTPFRLMTAKSLKDNLRYIPDGFNLSNVILSVIYFRRRQKVKFIDITFRPRQGGKNSINIPKIARIGIKGIKDFTKINKALPRKGE